MATVYRITPKGGPPVEGLVWGDGGYLQGEDGLRRLKRAAEGWVLPVHFGYLARELPPDQGFVRVFHPEQTSMWKDLPIHGATSELVREV